MYITQKQFQNFPKSQKMTNSEKQYQNLVFEVRNGHFKGNKYTYREFLTFLNINKGIFNKLLDDQIKRGFQYGKIKQISFTFKNKES